MADGQKHPGGRPLAFKSPEELQLKIDEYFQYCDDRAIKKVGDDGKEYMISSPAPYTMSGLARRLGIDRATLVNYTYRQEYFDTIRAAREKVHEDVETRMLETRNERGAMFSLKNNFSWKEETHSDITTKGKPLSLLSQLDAIPSNDSSTETTEAEQEN